MNAGYDDYAAGLSQDRPLGFDRYLARHGLAPVRTKFNIPEQPDGIDTYELLRRRNPVADPQGQAGGVED